MNATDSSTPSETDWDRVDAMADEDIDTSDVPPLTDSFFSRARWRSPREPVEVTLHLDPDLLAWFRRTGADCERRINAALRIYVEAHRERGL